MEPTKQILICPICIQECEFSHIYTAHPEFWDVRFPTGDQPKTVDEFNARFGPLGMTIIELEKNNP